MVLKVSFKDILFVICFFIIILFLIIIDNALRPKLNLKKIKENYLNLEKIIKKEFKNDILQKKYFQDKKVKIVFWHNLYPKEQLLMDQIIKEFQNNFPNIEVLNFSKGNWTQISKSISNSLPVNRQPHLSFSYPDHVHFYSKSHKIVPLNIFIDNDEDFRYKEKNNFFPSFLYPISLNEDSKDKDFYFFPFLKTTEVMLYNSNIIKEIKEKEKNDSPLKQILDKKINKEGIIINPLEWEDLKIICHAIKKNKIKEKDFIPIIIESESNLFIIDNEQRQKNSFPTNTSESKSFFHNPEIKKQMIYFKKEFVDQGLLTTNKLSGENNLPEFFKEQKNCFFISSSRRCSDLFNSNFIPEITYFPTHHCNTNINQNQFCQTKFLLQGANINLFYSNNKDEILASWLFLKYLTSKNVFIKIIESKLGIIFSREDVQNYFLKEKNKNDQNISKIKDDLQNNELSEEEKFKKNKLLFYYKFLDFNFKLKDDIKNQQQSFFSTHPFKESSFFRQVLSELFLEILSFDNNNKEYDLNQKVDFLFEESAKRINSN
ncbi:extracellular solute-binding protein [Candidatus Phytoplasma oryzae]|nr:extracellular solute-binding protein [Candidatus Phytoplasma oryzae]